MTEAVSKDVVLVSLALNLENFKKIRSSVNLSPSMMSVGASKALEYVYDYYKRYGDLPSKSIVESDNDIRLIDADKCVGTVDYYIDFICKRAAQKECNSLLMDLSEMEDPNDFISRVSEFKRSMSKIVSADIGLVNVVDACSELVERHTRRRSIEGGIDGVRSGYQLLDEQTLGFQRKSAYYLVAKSNTGKTFFLLNLAMQALADGKKVLFVSPEMDRLELLGRISSLKTRHSYEKLRGGRLSDYQLQEVVSYLDRISSNSMLQMMCATDGIKMSHISDAIESFNPDIVYIDSFYLIRSEVASKNKYETVAESVECIGSMKRKYNIPFVMTSQLNREGKRKDLSSQTTDTIAFSSQIENDADAIYHLFSNTEFRQQNKMLFRTMKARDHRPVHFVLNWDFINMDFSQIKECYEDGNPIEDEDDSIEVDSFEDEGGFDGSPF